MYFIGTVCMKNTSTNDYFHCYCLSNPKKPYEIHTNSVAYDKAVELKLFGLPF